MISEEHRSRRIMVASLENLSHYQDGGESFMESIVPRDETFVYKFILESKWSNLQTETVVIMV
jgi:hypothetical protein